MKCIIIDDETTARVIVKKLCTNHPELDVVASLESAIEGIKYLNQHEVDLIFLDMQMPNFNGMDFVQTLKFQTPIICITGDPNFAVDAFEYDNILAYILKPIDPKKFNAAIQKAISKKESNKESNVQADVEKEELSGNKFLYVNVDRRLIKIEMSSIDIIEAKGDYILIKTSSKNHTVHSTLRKIEEKLPGHLFLKVHRSFIINLQSIIDIEDNSVLINRDVIPISRSKKPELMERLNLL